MRKSEKNFRKIMSEIMIGKVCASFLIMDLIRFVIEYLAACHPECLARAMIHYVRVHDIPELAEDAKQPGVFNPLDQTGDPNVP